MYFIPNILFLIFFATTVYLFQKRIISIIKVIKLGKKEKLVKDKRRIPHLIKFAFGQKEMFSRPIVGALHFIVYIGFIIINIELLEILADGILGTHRLFLNFMGSSLYSFLIISFEYLAVLVIISCIVFLIRRNIIKIKRFFSYEMKGWPSSDANYILIAEIILMSLFLTINASEYLLYTNKIEPYFSNGYFFSSYMPSVFISDIFYGLSNSNLIIIERVSWWLHILGIFSFLIYVTYSKHLHIMFAFPSIYMSDFSPKGKFKNNRDIEKEIKMMLNPETVPSENSSEPPPEYFGVKDLNDLSQKQILESFTCTECGRCTSVCPQNLTGKKLSPRKIMMNVRDRAEDLIIKNGGTKIDEEKKLLDFISEEEIMACNTCNHCVEVCPVKLNPLSIIMGLRQHLVLDQAKVPQTWASMFSNVENNAAPWQFSPTDRDNWIKKIKE